MSIGDMAILAVLGVVAAFVFESTKIWLSEPRVSFSTVVEKEAGHYVYIRRAGIRIHNKGVAIGKCRAILQCIELIAGDLPACVRQDRLRWKGEFSSAECEIDIGPSDENQIVFLAQTTAGQEGSFWGDFLIDYCKNRCESIHGVYLVKIRIDGLFGEEQSMRPKFFSGYLYVASNQEIIESDTVSPQREVVIFEKGRNWIRDERIPKQITMQKDKKEQHH